MRKYEYTGTMPRSIPYGGTTFPVTRGCVMEAGLLFLRRYIPEANLREVPASTKAKYRFLKNAPLSRKDPMGGLPMRSEAGREPTPTTSPTAATDKAFASPYDGPPKGPGDAPGAAGAADEGKTAEKTATPPSKAPQGDEGTATPPSKTPQGDEGSGTDEKTPPPAGEDAKTGPAWEAPPNRTAIHKTRKDGLVATATAIAEAGAPLNPGLLGEMQVVGEDTHSGVIKDLLFKYYGME